MCKMGQNIRELIHLKALKMLGRWPGAGVYREDLKDLGLHPRAVESHSGVQSEGSDMADLHFEMVTQAALWRIGGEGGTCCWRGNQLGDCWSGPGRDMVVCPPQSLPSSPHTAPPSCCPKWAGKRERRLCPQRSHKSLSRRTLTFFPAPFHKITSRAPGLMELESTRGEKATFLNASEQGRK